MRARARAKPPKCPECASQKVWKDGLRRTRDGDVQRYLCRRCGYRFSGFKQNRVPKLQIKKHVTFQPLKKLQSRPDFTQIPICHSDSVTKKAVNDSSFSICEDVTPHNDHAKSTVGKTINKFLCNSGKRRVCASEAKAAKNLVEVQTEKDGLSTAATLTSADIKGLLFTFVAKSELKGLKKRTIECRLNSLKLLVKRGANLLDSESVFRAIDNAKRFDHSTKQLTEECWTDGTKNNVAQAYESFCEINAITIPKHINFGKWTRQPQKLPWIPLEREIDQLIAGCSRKVATFLQLLKETGARCGEAWRLEWTDIDDEHGIVTINRPEKNGLPRQFKVSGKMMSMLNMLPKISEKVFGDGELNHFRKNFSLQRKRVAHKLQNPRINRITFHTLRHFYATMEFHKTHGKLLHVKEKLGHRSITSTLIYTHLVNFEGDEYHTATSKSLKEDEELLKAGFEYVTDRDEIKIYRKRK